ncbi:MAG: twin-arginine translocase TatA/TatE family subunit [Planctomycetaceae bacterium]|jgi:sec-independent protein translocase protein TatA|nr:twin-arginine translocase TatA/TatE family subunit [Planctomycetaceae bacterium]MDG2390281.1 twin-arginine translocase TatA/TatE family subunit [Planctomycetaceae bacterium]
MMPGLPQILIVLLIVLLFFGKRIPETMKSLGLGMNEFKKGLDGVDEKKENQSVESEQKEKSDA